MSVKLVFIAFKHSILHNFVTLHLNVTATERIYINPQERFEAFLLLKMVNSKGSWKKEEVQWSYQHCSFHSSYRYSCTSVSCSNSVMFTVPRCIISFGSVLQYLLLSACFKLLCEQELGNVLTEHRHICQTLEDCIRQRHSTSDRWGSESERTGRRMLGGKRVVQGSWRPRYWTGFLLSKVNRIWMDRTCIPLQVLINEWSLNDARYSCLIMFDNDMKIDPGYWKLRAEITFAILPHRVDLPKSQRNSIFPLSLSVFLP